MTLTDQEVQAFYEQGFLVLRGVLTRNQAQHYRRVILDLVPRDLTIPMDWFMIAGKIGPTRAHAKAVFESPELLPLLCNDQLYAAAAQLLGEYRLRAMDGSVSISLRTDAGLASGDVLSQPVHVDASVPADVEFRFTPEEVAVAGLYYLTDVEPGGGGFHVMPGGHRWVEATTRARPDGRRLHSGWKQIEGVQTVEVTGEAGDFVLHHHLLPHAASHNRRPTARVAQFTRFVRFDHPHRYRRMWQIGEPEAPAPEGRWHADQLAVMTPLGRKLLGVEAW